MTGQQKLTWYTGESYFNIILVGYQYDNLVNKTLFSEGDYLNFPIPMAYISSLPNTTALYQLMIGQPQNCGQYIYDEVDDNSETVLLTQDVDYLANPNPVLYPIFEEYYAGVIWLGSCGYTSVASDLVHDNSTCVVGRDRLRVGYPPYDPFQGQLPPSDYHLVQDTCKITLTLIKRVARFIQRPYVPCPPLLTTINDDINTFLTSDQKGKINSIITAHPENYPFTHNSNDISPKDKGSCDNPCSCNQTETASTVNLKSGNYYHSQNVIAKPETLTLDLSYNNLENQDTPLGKGWTHNYNIRLNETTGSITLTLGNGDFLNFVLSGNTYLPDSTSNDTTTIIKNMDNSYTHTFKNGLTQTFNSTGQLSTITDANGNTTTLSYSGADLTAITDSTGRNLNITSSGGRISSIKDPAGRTTTFTYSGNLLISVTDPSGNSWTYTYDAYGNMTQKTNPAGFQSINVYDANGKNTSSTNPEGKTKTISYDSTTTSTITEKDGGIWTRTYDPTINASTVSIDPSGNTTSHTYDSKGNMLTSTTPNYNTTSYTYDTDNNITSVTDPLGHTINYTYNHLGKILTKSESTVANQPPVTGDMIAATPDQVLANTTSDVLTTTKVYDDKGNLLQTIDPKGHTTVFTYDTRGNLLTTTDPRNKSNTLVYDAYNNVSSITDQKGNTTNFTYDVLGNLLTETNPAGKITTYDYDVLNHLVKITDPLNHITQYTYDKMGNRLSTTDGNGMVTTSTYNYKNLPLTVVNALSNITTMVYSGSGCSSCGGSGNDKLISVTDANNNNTHYEYDLSGQLIKEIDPKGNSTSYVYFSDGTVYSRTDGNGNVTYYTYDAKGRLTSRKYSDGTGDTFTYNAVGNLITAQNANISYKLSYNTNNNLTHISDNKGRKIHYVLNSNGNRTKMTAPDGRITTYDYDPRNNLTMLVSNGNTYKFTYDTLNRRTETINPNGTSTTYTYDADSRIKTLDTLTSTGLTINSISHTYDNTINRVKKTEPSGTVKYTYDNVYRLIISATGKTTNEQYSYDATGNRTSGPTTSTTYSIDQGNQLTSTTNAIFSYDNNGNIITKTTGGITTTYTYDGENRLVNIETSDGSTIVYIYDPFGRRIEKTINGVTTKYLYDGANILYEYDNKKNITTRYTHNIAIDDPIGIETGGQLYAYHKDTLGSIRAITDSAQAIVNTYNYDNFGNMTQTGTLTQPFTYTGREWDKETGLYYYRARYYDPMEGRFIQKDPLSFAGGDVNLYGYVQNNPVNFIDPTGLMGFIPYLDRIGNAGNTIAQDVWGNGGPSKITDIGGLLLSKPQNEPLIIDPNNPAFKNYNTPIKNKCEPTKTNDFEKYIFNL
jgi:RHS repeat-associated protein